MKMLRNSRLVAVLAAAGLASGCGDSPVAVDDFMGCETVRTIQVGATVNGALSTSDCRLSEDDTYVDFYFLSLDVPRTVTVTQTSDDIDSYLLVFRESDEVLLGQNDDVDDFTLDSRLTISLPAGRFIIAANSYEIETGPYTLSVQ